MGLNYSLWGESYPLPLIWRLGPGPGVALIPGGDRLGHSWQGGRVALSHGNGSVARKQGGDLHHLNSVSEPRQGVGQDLGVLGQTQLCFCASLTFFDFS